VTRLPLPSLSPGVLRRRVRGPSELGAPPTVGIPIPSPWLAGAFGVLTLLSGAIILVPSLQFAVLAPDLDLVVNTAAALSATAAGGLIWARWREFGRGRDLLEAAGFLTLGVGGTIAVVVALVGDEDALGFSLRHPGQGPLYLWTLGRLLASLLFLAATAASGREPAPGGQAITEAITEAITVEEVATAAGSARRAELGALPLPGPSSMAARLWLISPSLLLLVAAPLLLAFAPHLPALIGPEGIARLQENPLTPAALPGVTPWGIGLQLVVAAVFLVTALRVDGSAGVAPGRSIERSIESRYLAVGYLLAAFSQVHMALYPGVFFGLVTTADLLRLAFYLVVFLGIQEQTRRDLRDLRLAAEATARLRAIEVQRATQEERAWLARELHDGLAQDLWLARLRVGRLSEHLTGGPNELKKVAEGAAEALDRALQAARAAVESLRGQGATNPPPLDDLLTRSAEAFRERSGVATELHLASRAVSLPAQARVELWRIAQEALNNVAKHAEATVVRVSTRVVEESRPRLEVEISDNGRGFRPGGRRRGVGLEIMAERARTIGAQLAIRSRPHDGTRVLVSLPLSQGATAEGANGSTARRRAEGEDPSAGESPLRRRW
jgi:signal transduction histidine kinase